MIRHFTRLSTWNYAIDLGMYPLGSCTMKYNPRVNEHVARLAGIATEHPYQPQELSQGCLKILSLLEKCLLEITGMDVITLATRGRSARRVNGSIADPRVSSETRQSAQESADPRLGARHKSGHCGDRWIRSREYKVQRRRPGGYGHLREQVSDDVAALMLTNPSTLGIFEQQIPQIAEILHAQGALLYMDGANMNALAALHVRATWA